MVNLRGSRARLISEMRRLQSQQWIDEKTRAVFTEFSLFNAQVNLFVGCTIVAEFGPDGEETEMFVRFVAWRRRVYTRWLLTLASGGGRAGGGGEPP